MTVFVSPHHFERQLTAGESVRHPVSSHDCTHTMEKKIIIIIVVESGTLLCHQTTKIATLMEQRLVHYPSLFW